MGFKLGLVTNLSFRSGKTLKLFCENNECKGITLKK